MKSICCSTPCRIAMFASGLIFQFEGTSMGEVNAMGFRRDFVLRGRRQTPEMD